MKAVAETRLSMQDRLKAIEAIYIEYPRQTNIIGDIEECVAISQHSKEPECMLILGWSGVGKTTIYEQYIVKHPIVDNDELTEVPVFVAHIPANTTIKGMVSQLLEALGEADADRGTRFTQTRRLKRLLTACKVRMIILDEFQHLIDYRSDTVIQDVANWLKTLLNEVAVPIALVGLPSSIRVLRENEQLSQRFATRRTLEPFKWETLEEQREFRRFLANVDKALPLAERSNLADIEMAFRLHRASGGIVRRVMRIIRRAARLAVQQDATRVTMEILAKTFSVVDEISPQVPQNPFLATVAEMEKWPKWNHEAQEYACRPMRGRRRALRAADVLTAQ